MWKLLSRITADKFLEHMGDLMHQVQKGIGYGSKGSKHQFLIDWVVNKDSRNRKTNLAIAWIDKWFSITLVDTGEFWGSTILGQKLTTFIRQPMVYWETKLYASSKPLTDVAIKCGIYQRDALSLLLFCVVPSPPSSLLEKSRFGYKSKSETASST